MKIAMYFNSVVFAGVAAGMLSGHPLVGLFVGISVLGVVSIIDDGNAKIVDAIKGKK